MTENARLVEKMRGSTDSNLRSVRSLELKVASLQGDLDLTKSELETVQTEYDSYKVGLIVFLSYTLATFNNREWQAGDGLDIYLYLRLGQSK